MRCVFCGSKISKKDEICPECGKYLSEKPFAQSAEKNNLGEILRFFKCTDFANNAFLCYAIFGVMLMLPVIRLIIDNPEEIKYLIGFYSQTLLMLIIGLVLLICGIISFFVFRKCYIGIKENGVYGRRPLFPLRTGYFEVYFEDIENFKCHIPLRKGTPYVKFTVKGKKYIIACLNINDCSILADCIRSAIYK